MKTKVLLIVIVLVSAFTYTAYSQFDWGDAPDPNYPTLNINNGAFHQIWPGIQMGIFNDAEGNGQPNFFATGDDIANLDDDDGVIFNSWILSNQTAYIIINVSVVGLIDAWIDFNIDGDWLDAGEQIFMNTPVNPGINYLTFNVPVLTSVGTSFTRIRFSLPGGLPPDGFAPDGEVEDYQLWLGTPPMGDVFIDPDPSMAFTQNEISLDCISDPNFGPPPLIIAAYNDEPFPGGPGIGVSYSTDGGGIWTNTHLGYPNNPITGVPFLDVFDPTVCIDDSGHVFVGHIATDNNWAVGPVSGLYVHKSTDGGISWQTPVQVAADNAAVSNPDPNYRLNDRDQIVSDNYSMSPYYNNIYITWIKDRGWYMPTPMSDIYFSHSNDGGNTFSAAVQINALANNLGNMPVPDVAKDGTVYVAWMDYNVIIGGQGNIILDKSTDGGVTFGADIPVYTVNLPPLNLNGGTDARSKGAAVLKVMPSNPQELYIVFAEDPPDPIDEADIFLIKSTDGGNMWSNPVRVNDDATTTDQILPWMYIKPNGVIDIAWYDRRNDYGGDRFWDIYFTSSVDGGNSFATNTQISTNSFDTPNPPKVVDAWMGEYLGLTADYNDAFVVYTSSFFDNNGDVLFTKVTNPPTDWGDAPDPIYPTLGINNGARHNIDGVTFLGTNCDKEPDGIPNNAATGDDINNLDDEDGVVFPVLWRGNTDTLNITATVGGYLNAWFDFNKDNNWADDTTEHVLVDVILAAGLNNVPLSIPSNAVADTTYARFRFASYAGLSSSGGASDGEVEDYRVVIFEPLPPDISINDVTIGSGQSECYNAIDSINVAATSPVVVQSGGEAIFIAGHIITFNSGFDAQSGSTIDAHITTSWNYCDNQGGTPIVANPMVVEEKPEKTGMVMFETSDIKLYPNPNTGKFTVDFMNDEYSTTVWILNFQGVNLYQNQFRNQRMVELDISTQPTGIYLIMIRVNGNIVTKKVIKN